MEPEDALPCSQEISITPCLEKNQSIQEFEFLEQSVDKGNCTLKSL
jgi:hypothetical protein